MRRPRVGVVGAGAGGLMAARFAAAGGAEVTVFESTADGGRKILISGGGRCNVLPSVAMPERYVTGSSPRALRRILRSWPLAEQRAFFEDELGIALRLEPETGKLFPVSNRARDVRDRLVAAAAEAGAELRFGVRVDGLRPPPGPGARWRIHLSGGETVAVDRVVVATGGLSVPKTGSDGAGLRWMEELGHRVHEPYPALTPLTGPDVHAELAGVSLEVTVQAPGVRPRFSTRGGFLFTHRGYSGPTVLDASHLTILSLREGGRQELTVQWCDLDDDAWDRDLQEARSGVVGTRVAAHLPARLARRLVHEAEVPWDRGVARLTREERRRLVRCLASYALPWTGDEGYKKAEVTGGGVALDEVDLGSLESRRAPGLFLCGEILDAFGPIGGHNFLWAWATGRAAGRGAAAPLPTD
ncbi:MAG: aminoacetone oxidase family FAD-binding enzyme [Gemmatimonadetes bacterium]|nr:aminoacetone oxidase family FAD-binding enzyme [Gemmatimonadota bacterium]NNK63165.1 aminoacetone oxidase family FAD-binding enzyme [Gemmatimonadota bacterium]